MIKTDRESFRFESRTRRPPLDRINCLMSFLYTLLLNDCISGLESVGLDPQLGFLHTLRPGRPSLGLDLIEEFRPIIADRLIMALINRKQLNKDHFEEKEGGAILLKDDARKIILSAFQQRKQEVITHPFLKQQMPLGMVPFIQARLLARYLRKDAEAYVPFMPR
jgi:CRISPR-associated protein Cas1